MLVAAGAAFEDVVADAAAEDVVAAAALQLIVVAGAAISQSRRRRRAYNWGCHRP